MHHDKRASRGTVTKVVVRLANGGSALAAALERNGVRRVFAIPGTHNLEIFRALEASSITTVAVRHEQSAGYAADGVARSRGGIGVCLTTSGPGLTNACTAVATAYADSIPLLVIAPGPSAETLGKDLGLLHELVDQRGHLASLTKATYRPERVDDVPAVVDEAIATMFAGRPRPVYLEVPIPVLEAGWSEADQPRSARRVEPQEQRSASQVTDRSIDSACEALRHARTPVLVAGGGAVGASKEVRCLAEQLGALVVTTVNGKGVVDERHPLSLGPSLRLTAARDAIAAADVLVVVGSELADTDLWGERIETGGCVVRVDVDPVQLDKNLKPDHALLGDAAIVLEELLARLGPAPADRDRHEEAELWRQQAAAQAALDAGANRAINLALAEALPDDTIVAGDSAQVSYFGTVHFWQMCAPSQFLYPTGYATLGCGLPAAIGAKLALPDHPVLALVGDGGFLFTAMELATAAALKLPLPVVVVDSGGYAEIRNGMRARGIDPIGVDLPEIDLVGLAQSLGAKGCRVQSTDELCRAAVAALSREQPSLIVVAA
jgi:thiamine pyrophosphate-dependent acetolactate synthase large subunit-like protein